MREREGGGRELLGCPLSIIRIKYTNNPLYHHSLFANLASRCSPSHTPLLSHFSHFPFVIHFLLLPLFSLTLSLSFAHFGYSQFSIAHFFLPLSFVDMLVFLPSVPVSVSVSVYILYTIYYIITIFNIYAYIYGSFILQ